MAGLPSITPWSVSSFVLQSLGAASYLKGDNFYAIVTWMTSPEDWIMLTLYAWEGEEGKTYEKLSRAGQTFVDGATWSTQRQFHAVPLRPSFIFIYIIHIVEIYNQYKIHKNLANAPGKAHVKTSSITWMYAASFYWLRRHGSACCNLDPGTTFCWLERSDTCGGHLHFRAWATFSITKRLHGETDQVLVLLGLRNSAGDKCEKWHGVGWL